MPDFCHLHCHTQYSLLDGASDIKKMVNKAATDGQSAVAITDHGNLFGAFKFVKEAKKAGLKPIIGCEFYMVENRHIKTFEKSKGQKDIRYHQLLLAKNEIGYKNLSKLSSIGYTEGLYGKYPRIDKEVLLLYHEGLIATSCCVGAEIPQTILRGDLKGAEEKLKWWLNLFGEDYYIELQRQSNMDDIDGTGVSQEYINNVLLTFAKKYNIKTIVTNDSHYLDQNDAEAHDILLCVNTGSIIEETKRFKFPSNDFYFKTKQEMNQLFLDLPEALDNTMEVASKIEHLDLSRDVLLPSFPMPENFKTQEEYLRHLTYVGAYKKYGNLDPVVEERINFELDVIEKSGYAGYFLIVQDFTNTARKLGVSVGPGRGSAAGSAVAYCLGITNIDPIKYDLLFERFLNPERVSLPDIDIDFDDEGREKVIDYVIEKYGKKQVAQIITYGTMAAKSALRDVGRVLNIPLSEVDAVAKSFPNHLEATLSAILAEEDIEESLKEKLKVKPEELERAIQFRSLAEKGDHISTMIKRAKELEGSVRNTGIHACGVIITPEDITNVIPVTVAKDTELLVSQFDNSVAEEAGLLKMDFLGLKTLTIIKDAVKNVKDTRGIEINIDEVPLDDEITYQLFQRGETVGIFQYESAGMQKYLKELRPTRFEDLIAMNALYRPGPLAYIPSFIARKNGLEPIDYDLHACEDILKETYGITVYQEQVMLLSQKLAGFTKGEADVLRKAMGKKQRQVLDNMKPKFIDQAAANGHPRDVLEKIWKDWEAFASYAFNKSHSTCYAYLAYQTAYLKAHYPAEFMAAVLNHNKNDISKLNFFLDECKKMKIQVLGPDINESQINFSVNIKGQIRFGLSALKGIGDGPVTELIEERNRYGAYKSLLDLVKRVNLRAVNKKCIDSLVLGGALDCFTDTHRAQYFAPADNYETFIELALRYGNSYQQQKLSIQNTLFSNIEDIQMPEPKIPECEEWVQIDKLEKEKEITGIYLSGHPLDDFILEFRLFVNCPLNMAESSKGREIKMGGIITSVSHSVSKRGSNYGKFTLMDYSGSYEFSLFGEKYEAFKHLLAKNNVVYVEAVFSQGYNSDRFFMNVKDIKLMDGLTRLKSKGIMLKISKEEATSSFSRILKEIVTKHKGSKFLKIRVYDKQNPKEYVDTLSVKYKVDVDYDFIKRLEHERISFRIQI